MRAVNLMPRDERGPGFDLGRLPLFAAAGGIVAVTAAAFLLASSAAGSADASKAELETVEASIAQVPKSQDAAVTAGAILQERSNRVAALSAALTGRTALDRVLRDISLVLPANAWLTNLDASAPEGVAPLAGAVPPTQSSAASAGVTIQGATYSHDTVAKVLARLAVVPSLAGVRLTSSSLVVPEADQAPASGGQVRKTKRAKPRSFVTFVVSASVKSGGSP